LSLKPRNSSRICISDPVTKEDFDVAVKLLEYPPKKVVIDDAIQTIEEGIAKLERLKKGAMETLLTKGIATPSSRPSSSTGGRSRFQRTERLKPLLTLGNTSMSAGLVPRTG